MKVQNVHSDSSGTSLRVVNEQSDILAMLSRKYLVPCNKHFQSSCHQNFLGTPNISLYNTQMHDSGVKQARTPLNNKRHLFSKMSSKWASHLDFVTKRGNNQV
ncbi:hypothetical protein CRM22_000943 [Opisthorchis felineus]|uniref:Uncharacterized protein n=1 Tax=Opisthorchis felineus TaxID=147828 RepID=A0A4S2MCT1_OPIFE|nr:hypothetical protein CRM22_000943 [Opisthorchis felineus]